MKAQIFSNKGMVVFCDTFNCHQRALYFIGNPVGPMMQYMNLCQECRDSILRSLIDEDRQGVTDMISNIELEERIAREKETHGGKEFPCKYCGEIFYSPNSLGIHSRNCEHKPQKEKEEK